MNSKFLTPKELPPICSLLVGYFSYDIVRYIEKIPNKTLRVDIVRLKSTYEEKLPFLKVRVQAALRARCTNTGENYSRTYSYQKHLNSVPASTFPNENLINDTLSETLKKMFEDEKLISCLAQ